ncbi:MAG: hydroxyacid dehydrogenase [Nitrososphaerota archaeon]|nr:hydroxyacid dehydrogenase [Nitrososphaerota archaeon]
MKILVSDPISEDAIALLKASSVQYAYFPDLNAEQLLKEIGGYDALIVRSRTKVTKDVISRASNLKVIGRAGVGVDNIDSEAARAKQIKVLNTPDALTNAVAEFTIGLMISLARKVNVADATMKSGKWNKSLFHGLELKGRIYGTIGIGRIGQRVAELATAFGMKVMANDVIPIPEALVKRLEIRVSTQEEIFKTADFVDLHVPLTEQTKYLVNYETLKKMKKSAYLINTARGKVVNEADLVRALNEKLIAGAALDVFEVEPPTQAELLKNENVILTPHIAGQTVESQLQAGTQIVQQVLDSLGVA